MKYTVHCGCPLSLFYLKHSKLLSLSPDSLLPQSLPSHLSSFCFANLTCMSYLHRCMIMGHLPLCTRLSLPRIKASRLLRVVKITGFLSFQRLTGIPSFVHPSLVVWFHIWAIVSNPAVDTGCSSHSHRSTPLKTPYGMGCVRSERALVTWAGPCQGP